MDREAERSTNIPILQEEIEAPTSKDPLKIHSWKVVMPGLEPRPSDPRGACIVEASTWEEEERVLFTFSSCSVFISKYFYL